MKLIINMSIAALSILLLISCAASTGSRYEKDDIEKDKVKTVVEDFDITPYKTKIEIDEEASTNKKFTDVWYEYKNTNETGNRNRKIVATVDGYRVLIVATDNIEEANEIRDKVAQQTNGKEVYISFEPPFYKVKVGDFTDLSEANDLQFKLKQLGYSEARVVQESVNIFE